MKTNRHLIEYWRIEVAQPCGFDALIGIEEELLAHICRSLLKEATGELELLRVSTEDLRNLKTPFPRLTYDEVVDILQKTGSGFLWGQKIDWDAEKHISFKFNRPFFITEFPIGIQTLFYKPHSKKPGLTRTVDLIAPGGYGEVGGGGQMEDGKKVLLRKMSEEKIDAEDQKWYMSLKGDGVSPNSGFVFGVERLIAWICKLEHIKDASAFPRLPDNIYP